MESVVGKELDLLQNELFSYFEMKETDKIIPLLEELAGEDEMDDDDRNMLTTLMLKWIIFHESFKSGTLAQQYIDAKRKQKKLRPSVMKQLEKWHDIAPSFSIITKVIDEDWVEVIDLVSEDRKTVKLFDDFLMQKKACCYLDFYFHMAAIILTFYSLWNLTKMRRIC